MFLLKDLIRISSQNRTLYCYLVLSIWIFLLVAGMYKYIGSTDNPSNIFNSKSYYNSKLYEPEEEPDKTKKYQQEYCMNIESIVPGDEGGAIENFHLQGVLLLIRHGDRAPLVHVKGINTLDCSHEGDAMLNKYKNYLSNSSTAPNTNGHSAWMKQGPFHGFPLLPADPKACLLGQLTYKGISQLLHVGDLMRMAYANSLDLYRKPLTFPPKTNSSESLPPPIAEDIIVFTTRYRRTFQSALALLFTLLPTDRWNGLQILESHSLSFCFSDCACPNAEYLKKVLSKESSSSINKNAAISTVVQWIGGTLLQNFNHPVQNALDVRDALLTYICHDMEFPCRNGKKKSNDNLSTTTKDTADASDVIFLDQDEPAKLQASLIEEASEEDSSEKEPVNDGCVDPNQIEALLTYSNWSELRESKNKLMIQQRLLRAYGLIRNIVNFILKMISGDKVKFVLYSCHDKTLQYLLSSLGLILETPYIPYAARLSFEVYRSEMNTQFYIRLIYNGRDVTKSVSFCEGGKSLRVKRGRMGKADLCPIENIIRFTHDDFFAPLNATNFKDACAVPQIPVKDIYSNYF